MKCIILIALLCSLSYGAWHWGSVKEDRSIDSPVWTPICVLPDSVVVSWVNEFGIARRVKCIGLWYSQTRKEYMLTWTNSERIILQASNITDLEWKPVK
jgi:hypothetical protein